MSDVLPRALHDLQVCFQEAILDKADAKNEVIDAHLEPEAVNASGRFQIYQNNRIISLKKRLKNLYPTVQRIVGEAFFEGVVHQYLVQHPLTFGMLHTVGDTFPHFLSTFPPASTLPYLSDVARLEWANHEVYYEKNAGSFDFAELRGVPSEKYGCLKFKLHPAARLLASLYPVLDIWQLCQSEKDDDEVIDVNLGGDRLLVIRRQLDITFEKLEEGEFALLSAFSQGQVFQSACGLALQAEPNFNIENCLQTHILQGAITDFYL